MPTPEINETTLAAFGEELQKLGSTWYGNVGQGIKRFGQRQLHSVTGYLPKGAKNIEAIRGGAWDAQKALSEAKKGKGKVFGPDVVGAREALKAERAASKMGLTNIPGYAKSLMKDPKGTLSTALKQQWNGTTPFQKALTVGLPAAGLVGDVVSEDDGHKNERIGAGIASTAAGLVTGSMPFLGSAAVGMGAGYLGGKAGHLFDSKKKLHARVQPPPNPEDARGMATPVEREMSPNAAGRPEVIG